MSACDQALILSHIQTFSDTSAADDFWKHCQKEKFLKLSTISPFVTMFSILSSNYIIICIYFLCLFLDVDKVVGCRFVVCGRWLKDMNLPVKMTSPLKDLHKPLTMAKPIPLLDPVTCVNINFLGFNFTNYFQKYPVYGNKIIWTSPLDKSTHSLLSTV